MIYRFDKGYKRKGPKDVKRAKTVQALRREVAAQ